jgi:8-amino-7-oxononanoate synthase
VSGFERKLLSDLQLRKAEGIYRVFPDFDGTVDFYSNDYLGFARLSFETQVPFYCSSRLIGGHSLAYSSLENQVADFFSVESALCFNSGYAANIGVIPALCKKNDTILYDAACHTSIKDGVRLSYAQSFKFKHNDSADLERLLEKRIGKETFIITEGLFSMLGDVPPLDEFLYLAEKYDAKLIIDEAHSAGIFGNNGKGIVAHYSTDRIVAKLVTFGKAFGSHGAAILCSARVKEYLINFARSFIYTTALPAQIIERTRYIIAHNEFSFRREKLEENINLFNRLTAHYKKISHLNSPIKIIQYTDADKLKEIELKLKLNGIGCKAIFAPTVPKGEECLRIILHSFNTPSEIERLCEIIASTNSTFVKNNISKTQL